MKSLPVYMMAVLYMAAGILHFVKPSEYVKIVPPWLPSHLQLVYISGLCEIILGALLVPAPTRSIAAWGIIILLVAIFPANIQMTVNYFHFNNSMRWLTVLRLPLQLVLIWWAWLYTKPR